MRIPYLHDNTDATGKRVLVTGASGTFGRAIARRSPVLQLSRRPAGSEATQFWGRWVRKVMRRPWLSATARSSS